MLPALCQVVRAVPGAGGARGGRVGPVHTQHSPAARARSLRRPVFVLRTWTEPRPLRVWSSRRPGPSGRPCDGSTPRRFAGAFTLRQRMLNFVQNIQYYMMFEVMEPTWHVLEKNLRAVSPAQPAPHRAGGWSAERAQGPGRQDRAPRLPGGEAGRPGLRLLEERILPSEPQCWTGTPSRALGPFSQGHVTKLQDRKHSEQCILSLKTKILDLVGHIKCDLLATF